MVPEFVAGVLGLLAGGFLLTTVGFGVAWIRARERAIRAQSQRGVLPEGADLRLERIEQAVDAIAVEVERLGEGERFRNKLLAGEAGQPRERPESPPRIVTPH